MTKLINIIIYSVLLFEFVLSMTSRLLPQLKHTTTGIIDINPINLDNKLPRRMVSGGTLTDSDKQTILNAHNQYRTITASGGTPNQPSATSMNELFWDPALAAVAQNYSRSCLFAHNDQRLAQYLTRTNISIFEPTAMATVGENLYLTTRMESLDTLLTGLAAFYAEYQYFTYNSLGCVSGQQCGHYLQMVQASTRYVGCGYTYCPVAYYPGGNAYYYDAILLTCDYSPQSSSTPYLSGTPCSQCDLDRVCVNQTMCGGCPNPYYNYCEDTTSSCINFANYCPTNPKCSLNSTSALCTLCRNTCSSCYNSGINVTKPISNCNNGIGNINNYFNNAADVSPNPTTSPTLIPTLKPTPSPTIGINNNYCCHAYDTSRYEDRCNLLTTTSTCNDVLYSRRCYWASSNKCVTNPPTIADTQYYCTATGSRKQAACEVINNEAECEYNTCSWEPVSSR